MDEFLSPLSRSCFPNGRPKNSKKKKKKFLIQDKENVIRICKEIASTVYNKLEKMYGRVHQFSPEMPHDPLNIYDSLRDICNEQFTVRGYETEKEFITHYVGVIFKSCLQMFQENGRKGCILVADIACYEIKLNRRKPLLNLYMECDVTDKHCPYCEKKWWNDSSYKQSWNKMDELRKKSTQSHETFKTFMKIMTKR